MGGVLRYELHRVERPLTRVACLLGGTRYTKNEGHPERDGFGNTFSAQPGTASPGVAPQINEEPAHKTGMLAAFMDYLYLGPKVANEPDYLPLTKRLVLIIISITGVLGPLTGSIYSPALPAVKAEFHTTTEWVNGTLTAGILALGIAPLAWSPVSDRNGRRIILILSQLCNIGGCVICYFSPSIYVFLVGRIIQAAGSGAGLSVGAGVVADVFKREERGRAFGVFYLGPLIGPGAFKKDLRSLITLTIFRSSCSITNLSNSRCTGYVDGFSSPHVARGLTFSFQQSAEP